MQKIVAEWLRQRGSRLSVEQFAGGVIRVVNATMEKAIRVVSIERGFDPRDFTLVAFGGAGGLHACELAEAMGIPRVIVPAYPGALSAFGILVSDIVKDYSRTILLRVIDKLPLARLDQAFAKLRTKAEADFAAEGWPGKISFRGSMDVRFRGQGYELNVPYTHSLLQAFHREHERRYGFSYPGREIELVTMRLRARIKSAASRLADSSSRLPSAKENGSANPSRAAVVLDGKKVSATIYDRESIRPGKKLSGPAIVTEYSATTLVPKGKRFRLDRTGNLVIEI